MGIVFVCESVYLFFFGVFFEGGVFGCVYMSCVIALFAKYLSGCVLLFVVALLVLCCVLLLVLC